MSRGMSRVNIFCKRQSFRERVCWFEDLWPEIMQERAVSVIAGKCIITWVQAHEATEWRLGLEDGARS